MKKVVRVINKGTSRRTTEKEPDNWAGDSYKKVQEQRREAAKNVSISMAKGTKKVKYRDLARTSGRPSGKGRIITTGKGTSRRKL